MPAGAGVGLIASVMMRPLLAAILPLTIVIAAPAVASAQPIGMGDVTKEMGRTEIRPMRTPLLGVAAGFHGDVALMGEVELGYAWGEYHDRWLLPKTRLWRASAVLRGAYGQEDSVAASALVGWGTVSLVGFVIQGGADVRLDPGDVDAGPIVQLTGRLGPFGLKAGGWVHLLDADPDWGWSVGLGWTFNDFKKPIVDPAKDRAKEAVDRVR